MMLASSLYDISEKLFINYPLALDEADDGPAIRSMVLSLPDGDQVRYFMLSQHFGEGRSWYSVRLWPAGATVIIDADRDALISDTFVSAVSGGTPLPRDGSLFGWTHNGVITALIAVYTEYSPEVPEPCWSVMPCADVPDARWPPFTREPLIGNWFWELAEAGRVEPGRIVSIEGLIAGTSEKVFWVGTETVFGSDCCVVAEDIWSPEGYTLPSGCYVYHEVLRAGSPIPSVHELLDSADKTDLARRFHRLNAHRG